MCLKAKRNWVKGLQLNANLICCIKNDSNNKVCIKISAVNIWQGYTFTTGPLSPWVKILWKSLQYASQLPVVLCEENFLWNTWSWYGMRPWNARQRCLSLPVSRYLCFHKWFYQPQRLDSHLHTGRQGFKMRITKTVTQNALCKPCYSCQGGQLREQKVETGTSSV